VKRRTSERKHQSEHKNNGSHDEYDHGPHPDARLLRGEDRLADQHRSNEVGPVRRHLEPRPLASLLTGDQTGLHQHGEVVTDRGLASTQRLIELTRADFSLGNAGDQTEKAKPYWISNSLEVAGERPSLLYGEGFICQRDTASRLVHAGQSNILTVIDITVYASTYRSVSIRKGDV